MRFGRLVALAVLFSVSLGWSQAKPKLTLDEFFNYVGIGGVKISPDGNSVVVGTRRADWAQDKFRRDLWLVRVDATPILLTSSGEDSEAEWSPDGKWIAFLSDRPIPWTKTPGGDDDDKPQSVTHLYVISVNGGEALPITRGEESVGSYVWSRDSKSLYFSTREPWSKAKRDAYKKQWKDVVQYREADRGDVIARIAVADGIARAEAVTPYIESADSSETKSPADKAEKKDENKDKETAETPGTVILGKCALSVNDLALSHDGRRLAFISGPPYHRIENVKDHEIFVMEAAGGEPRQFTHNQALENDLRWAPDDKQLFFTTGTDGVEDKYQRVQSRIYSIDLNSQKAQRWANGFNGSAGNFEISDDGTLVASGQLGLDTQIYTQKGASAPFSKAPGSLPGSYESLSVSQRSPKIAFTYSAFGKPAEVYVADSVSAIAQAKPITSFNKLFSERDLPQGRAFQWKSEDGTSVEGVLIYPPGKFGQKNLPLFTLIHGGPEDADGNSFGANWYDWANLAASQGWLVFRPNYRGSTGYGDKFELEIMPKLVSVPGKDILSGVDALVKEGIADPDRLTIGGYSYGGYMTNWIITQSSRFKAAVTGAGAVEHIANWGNDDLTYDDAWYLGGTPWEVPENYHSEAAIYQITKIKTPTHIVGGSVDIRVYIGEQYLLERALQTIDVPHALLVFPGEGHGLSRNPWHGKIKVREELKWLDKYCPLSGTKAVNAGGN
jgi:dipeptidyl aminopeptidase/acylaminoacyl peptidase